MKRKSILDRQSVKRKGLMSLSNLWKYIRLATSFSFKICLLLIGMVGVSLLFLYLYQYLITSPFIKLKKVVFTGVDEGIKQELIEQSRLSTDLSLLGMNLDNIKDSMENHPWVKSVMLEKQFPHTLIIHVEKQVPRALVILDNLAYVNQWGDVFKDVGLYENKDLPVITGISNNENLKEMKLKLAMRILDQFGKEEDEEGIWSLKDLSEIHIDNEEGDISLYFVSLPAVIKMGKEGLEGKKDELLKIIAHLRTTGRIHTVRTIDMNYRNGAVVSFKNSINQSNKRLG